MPSRGAMFAPRPVSEPTRDACRGRGANIGGTPETSPKGPHENRRRPSSRPARRCFAQAQGGVQASAAHHYSSDRQVRGGGDLQAHRQRRRFRGLLLPEGGFRVGGRNPVERGIRLRSLRGGGEGRSREDVDEESRVSHPGHAPGARAPVQGVAQDPGHRNERHDHGRRRVPRLSGALVGRLRRGRHRGFARVSRGGRPPCGSRSWASARARPP